MPSNISGTTRVFVVIGDPVVHSLSPAMHNAAFRVLGLDAVYVARRVPVSSLSTALSGLEALGIGGNITVPHKVQGANLIVRLTETARELDCVNTFWVEEERFRGDNTDVAGVLEALVGLVRGGVWLLLGTGGAARAVIPAAREHGARVLIRSRSADRAREFVSWAQRLGVDAEPDEGGALDLAINATPLGLGEDDPKPIPESRLIGCRAAFDMVYRRGGTPWIRRCANMGMRVADGRHMLLGQGAEALERFYPEHRAPRDVMAAAIDAALAG